MLSIDDSMYESYHNAYCNKFGCFVHIKQSIRINVQEWKIMAEKIRLQSFWIVIKIKGRQTNKHRGRPYKTNKAFLWNKNNTEKNAAMMVWTHQDAMQWW